jgi:N4-gp56 family major capsid protein
MSAQTTSGLSAEVSTYYEKVFLERAKYEAIFAQGLQTRKQPANEGKVVYFTRHTPLAVATTALTEGVNPAEVALTASTVSATLAEYGNSVKISRFLSLTSIDANNKEKIEVVGQNMGETIDELVRNELFTGATAQLAGGAAALTAVAASNVFSAAEIRKAVRTLKANKARPYSGGNYSWVCKTGPFPAYDLMGDSTFVQADTYDNAAKNIYRGDLGVLYGVRFWESPNQKTESSTVTVYSNFIHGSDAAGVTELSEDGVKLYIIPHTQIDSGNPAGRFSLVSWAGSHVTKTLNSNWLINVKSGATA